MARFKIIKEAYVKYSMTTWQGTVDFDGTEVLYRFSESDDGSVLFVYDEISGWSESDLSDKNHASLYAACIEWGSPEEIGSVGTICDMEIDEYTE